MIINELDMILDDGSDVTIEAVQQTAKDETRLTILSEQFVSAKERKAELEAELKAVKAEIERLDRDLSDEMALMEYDNFSRKGKTFFLRSRLFASPKSGCKEELFSVLREKGYGDMITESVNANTLSSFVKEKREENNGEIPEWLNEVVNSYEKISVGTHSK